MVKINKIIANRNYSMTLIMKNNKFKKKFIEKEKTPL